MDAIRYNASHQRAPGNSFHSPTQSQWLPSLSLLPRQKIPFHVLSERSMPLLTFLSVWDQVTHLWMLLVVSAHPRLKTEVSLNYTPPLPQQRARIMPFFPAAFKIFSLSLVFSHFMIKDLDIVSFTSNVLGIHCVLGTVGLQYPSNLENIWTLFFQIFFCSLFLVLWDPTYRLDYLILTHSSLRLFIFFFHTFSLLVSFLKVSIVMTA